MTRKGKILGPHTASQLGLSENHIFVDTNVLVGGYSGKDVDAAFVETGADIEDNVQYVLAKKQKCRIVVTNNYKDYRMMPGIQVFRPTEVRRLPR